MTGMVKTNKMETKPNYYDTQKDTSASIVAQVILKAATELVCSGKIEPGNIKANAAILADVYKTTKKGLLDEKTE